MNAYRWILFIILVSGTLTGCYSTIPDFDPPAALLEPQRLAAVETQMDRDQLPMELYRDFLPLYLDGKRNEVMHLMHAGLEAYRAGYFSLAAKTLDRAIAQVEALQEGAGQAERVKGKFVAEEEKWFKGESYERSALYFYRGLLYLQAADFDNAAAAFKRSELHDITGEEAEGFAGDWFSSEWALALASYKSGFPEDAARALERTKNFATRPKQVELPDPGANLLLVVETGGGPVKVQDGDSREKLKFALPGNQVAQLAITTADGRTRTLAPAEDLFVQATTRGTRQIDYILGDKATFKEGASELAGDATIAAAVATGVAVGTVGSTDPSMQNLGAGASIFGGLMALTAFAADATADATRAEADIRAWQNLPGRIFLTTFKVNGNPQRITLHFLGPNQKELFSRNLTLFAAPAPDRSQKVAMTGLRHLDRAQVRSLQQILSRLGFDPGSADGQVGERTRQAVAAFRREMYPGGQVSELEALNRLFQLDVEVPQLVVRLVALN